MPADKLPINVGVLRKLEKPIVQTDTFSDTARKQLSQSLAVKGRVNNKLSPRKN
jgi:hypothetical protein